MSKVPSFFPCSVFLLHTRPGIWHLALKISYHCKLLLSNVFWFPAGRGSFPGVHFHQGTQGKEPLLAGKSFGWGWSNWVGEQIFLLRPMISLNSGFPNRRFGGMVQWAWYSDISVSNGGSRGGAQGARPTPYFGWKKKKWLKKEKQAGQVK